MLDFLKQITVEDPGTIKRGGGGVRKEWNPTDGLVLRVWKDGSIYPSQALVDWFGLEYKHKEIDNQGNGLDIFSSEQFKIFKSPKTLILLNVVNRDKPKIDVFGTVTFYARPEGLDADKVETDFEVGEPITSVMDQGSTTFGKNHLLPMIKEVYSIEPNEKGFIDLVVAGADGLEATQPFTLPDGKVVCHVPKVLSRGKNLGAPSYVKRDNPRLYVLYPFQLAYPAAQEEATTE